jgi:hypothetical protein
MKKLIFILFLFSTAYGQTVKVMFKKRVGGSAGFYRTVTTDHTKVPNTNQTNFAVLVSGTYTYLKSVANGGKVQDAQGDDIYFTSDAAATTVLNFELTYWDATTGQIEAWVLVSSLSHTSDNVIYLQYGNSSITSFQGNITGTWNSNYKIVSHLKDGTTLSAADVTSNGNNGTIHSATATTGKIDGAASFNGTTATISYPDIASITDYTMSAWVNANTLSGIECAFGFETFPSSPRDAGIFWVITSESGSSVATGKVIVNGTGDIAAGSALSTSTWYYAVIQRSGTTAKVFINGSQIGSSITVGSGATSVVAPTLASHYYSGADHELMDGLVDEFRFSNTARSDDWIVTEYNNQNSPSTFYALGSEVAH